VPVLRDDFEEEPLHVQGTVLFIVRDVGPAPLVRHGVDMAPLGGDEAVVSAAVFALDIVAHGVLRKK
jgi:hypothetical protein